MDIKIKDNLGIVNLFLNNLPDNLSNKCEISHLSIHMELGQDDKDKAHKLINLLAEKYNIDIVIGKQ